LNFCFFCFNTQDLIEKKLESDHNAELNEANFTKFVFDSHVEAYVKAGICALPVLDKVKITLAVDPKHLFTEQSMNQVVAVGQEQIKYWANNSTFAAHQAWEAYKNKEEVLRLVTNYAAKHLLDVELVKRKVIEVCF
jgi:hypothetical protein